MMQVVLIKAVKLKKLVTIFSGHHSLLTFAYAGGSSTLKTVPSEEHEHNNFEWSNGRIRQECERDMKELQVGF
jgi:hypothetical protein